MGKDMMNLSDYINLKGNISFEESPFNEVDNLLFAELSYIDFEGIISPYPSEKMILLSSATGNLFKAKKKEEIVLGLIIPREIIQICDDTSKSKRYENVRVSNYINKISKEAAYQFSAMCFHMPNDIIYIAFRGTDDTLIGWQEDLNMISTFPVPSQSMAVEYVNTISTIYKNSKIIIGGHSKGGNLAFYSAIFCNNDIKDRIINVYNNDGPGFFKEQIAIEKLNSVDNKLISILPKSSIIGLMFDNIAKNTIIIDTFYKGIRQHDALSWLIEDTAFVRYKSIDNKSIKFKKYVDKVLVKLTDEDRVTLTKNVYDFVMKLSYDTLLQFSENKSEFFKKLKLLPYKNKRVFIRLIFNLFKYNLI